MGERTKNQWGPVPDLARALRTAGPWTACLGRHSLEKARSRGGPWGLAVNWPDLSGPLPGIHFFEPSPSPVHGPPRLLREVGADLLWRVFSALGLAPKANQPAAFESALVSTQVWLEERNLRYLADVLAPVASSHLYEFARVSGLSVAWAVLAWYVERYDVSVPLEGSYQLGADCCPGDVLAVHLLAEDVVSGAVRGRSPQPEARFGGGLRTAAFLGAYDDGRGPGQAVSSFVASSPLTQLFYRDLLEPRSPLRIREALIALLGLGRDPVTHRPERAAEMWIGQIARTVLAMLQSPPPGQRALRRAESDMRRFRRSSAAFRRAQAELREARSLWRRSYVHRADDLALLFSSETQRQPDADVESAGEFESTAHVEPDEGLLLLQYRVLDGLVRSIAEGAAPEWPALRDADRLDPFPNPTRAVLGARSPGFDAFCRTLLGGSRSDLGDDDLSATELRRLERLLAPPRLLRPDSEYSAEESDQRAQKAKEIASHLRVSAPFIERSCARLDAREMIPLACGKIRHASRSGREILLDWYIKVCGGTTDTENANDAKGSESEVA